MNTTKKRGPRRAQRARSRIRRAPASAAADDQAVYAGRVQRGTITRRKNQFVARDADGHKLGQFARARDAIDAVLGAPDSPAADRRGISPPGPPA